MLIRTDSGCCVEAFPGLQASRVKYNAFTVSLNVLSRGVGLSDMEIFSTVTKQRQSLW